MGQGTVGPAVLRRGQDRVIQRRPHLGDDHGFRDFLLSLFFAVLKIGAEGLQQVGVPNQIYLIIQTVIIFFMAAQSGFLEAAAQNPWLQKLLPKRKAVPAPAGADEKGGEGK